MSENNRKPVISYIHIPKTAGNSIDRFLFNEFNRNEVLDRIEQLEFNHILPYQPKVISGHWARRSMSEFCDANDLDPKFYSCVRDPVKRLISNIQYAMRFASMVKRSKYPPLESIDQVGIEKYLENNINNYDSLSSLQNIQWKFTNIILPNEQRRLDIKEQIEEAIDSFHLIGLTEYLFQTVLLMAFELRILAPSNISSQNVNSKKITSSKYSLTNPEIIEKFCGMDIELYEMVQKSSG